MVKNTIPCTPVPDPASCGEGVDVQAVTLTLRHTSLLVYNIYKPHDSRLNLEEIFDHASITPTFVGGDFNCHHPILGSQAAANRDGRHLAMALNEAPGICLLNNGEATHIRGNTLDLSFISSTLRQVCSWSLHPTLTSDHFAILCEIGVGKLPPPPPPPPRWNTKKADWASFIRHLQDNPHLETPPPAELNQHEEMVTAALRLAADHAIPMTKPPTRTFKEYWFRDKRVAEMNSRLNATRKLFRNHPTPENRDLLTAVTRHATQVKAEVRDEKWMEWCQSLDSHTSLGAMWKKLRSIRNKGPPPPPSHPDPQGEAERLAEKFASRTKSTNLPPATRNELHRLRNGRVLAITTACEEGAGSDTPFTPAELQNVLKTGSDTSPGADGITHSMIRHAGPEGHAALLALFNASLREGKLPSKWKEATIAPIPKPKEPGAYRPISLLSCLSKTMERMVLNRLQWVTGPLHPAIHAYTKGTGTAECLAGLLTSVGSSKSTAVFLDLEKAFELADETVILARLAEKGVKGQLLRWTRDYLSNRKASVRFQGHTSTPHHHEHGTPQGSVISPFLFNTLVEALLFLPLPRGCHLITYADDITLVATGPFHRLNCQQSLTRLDRRCRELGLKLNLNKSKAMTAAV